MTRRKVIMPLFENSLVMESIQESLGPGAMVLRRFVCSDDTEVLAALADLLVQSPFRHMMTPTGVRMSVGMTNCGSLGWVSDTTGYRYDAVDPMNGRPWPSMPAIFLRLATRAAATAGFDRFMPDACLINRYEPRARLSLHQDKNELDFQQPIVSVSLGLPATFLFGGARRKDEIRRIPVAHGDVVVWGGPARLYYHGVLPLQDDHHPLVGDCRINLTFRKAG